MRRSLATALILAISLALSASAGAPALAATIAGGGYDSSYAGESVFTAVAAGSTGQMSAIFFNSGTQPWAPGVVGLLVCFADKVTCGVASPNGSYAASWYSSSTYASVTAPVLPGQNGFFVYSFTVPGGTPPGTVVTFNGDVGLIATGALLHPQGYYQQNTVPTPTTPYVTGSFDPPVIAADGVSSSALNVSIVYPGGQVPPITPRIIATRAPLTALYCRITAVPGGQSTTLAADGSTASAVGVNAQFTVTSSTFPGECDISIGSDDPSATGSVVPLATRIILPPSKLGVASGGGATRPAAATGTCTVFRVGTGGNDNPSCIEVLVDVQDINGNRVTADSSRVVTATLDPSTCSGAPGGDVNVAGSGTSSTTVASATVVRGRATFVLSSAGAYSGCRITFSAAGLDPATTTEVWTAR